VVAVDGKSLYVGMVRGHGYGKALILDLIDATVSSISADSELQR
jgi:hypothetical protein